MVYTLGERIQMLPLDGRGSAFLSVRKEENYQRRTRMKFLK